MTINNLPNESSLPETDTSGQKTGEPPPSFPDATASSAPCSSPPSTSTPAPSSTSSSTSTLAPSPQESSGQKARTLLKTLQDRFPVFSNSRPLAIGIDRMLRERIPDINRKVLRISLGIHTHSLRYLKTMEKATHRLDLDGNACEEITDEHRQHAVETIRERSKKQTERKKVLREAEALEKERREKLTQLVQKFASTR